MATVKKSMKSASKMMKPMVSARKGAKPVSRMMQAPPTTSAPMGGMMKKGGKIKKAQNGIADTKLSEVPGKVKEKARKVAGKTIDFIDDKAGKAMNFIGDKAGKVSNRVKNATVADAADVMYPGTTLRYGYRTGKNMLQSKGILKKKFGGNVTSKSKKFAALAPPKNKITFADKIAGAKKKK